MDMCKGILRPFEKIQVIWKKKNPHLIDAVLSAGTAKQACGARQHLGDAGNRGGSRIKLSFERPLVNLHPSECYICPLYIPR